MAWLGWGYVKLVKGYVIQVYVEMRELRIKLMKCRFRVRWERWIPTVEPIRCKCRLLAVVLKDQFFLHELGIQFPYTQITAKQIKRIWRASYSQGKREMGHHSCCNQQKVKRGLWSPEEDEKLIRYITTYGYGCWSEVPEKAGLTSLSLSLSILLHKPHIPHI